MTAWTYRRTLLAATLLVCFLTAAFGQTGGTGVLRGTVYDPARATVPQAKVVLTQVATNIVREVPANEVGFFLFAGLAPGEYTLTVEFSGFKKWTGRLQMVAGQTAVAEPVLEVGSVEAAVEVTSAAPIITTESAEVGTVKDNVRIQQLPLNGRSVTNLFDLTPGVEGGANPRVNGMKVGAAEMTLDGVSLVDRFGGGMARVQPGLDTVQEFRIETVGSGAQFARPATVTLVTKGGTNEFHGSMFETFRNNGGGLLARKRQDGNSAAFLARNEFGISGGGPVLIPKLYNGRNKSFWFVAYEGLRQRQKTYYEDTVPTEALWAGDFSGVMDPNLNKYTIYDPLTTGANGTRTPFANNRIPTNRINPFFNTMKGVTHAPTNDTNVFLGPNMQTYYPLRTNADNLTIRGDHNFNDKNILTGRLTHSKRRFQQLGGLYGAPREDITNGYGTSRNDADVYNAAIRYTKTFTPTLFSETLFAVNRAPKSSGTLADNTDWANKLGLPNPFGAGGWPTMYAGSADWNTAFSYDADNRKDEMLTAYIVQPNMTWVKGNHTIMFGGQYRKEQNNIRELQQAQGEHDFSGAWTTQYDPASDSARAFTGDGFASMALGLGDYYSAQYNRGYFYFRQQEIGAYIQDTWKVTPRLTLSLGLRYDLWTPYKEKYDRLVNVDMSSLANTFQVVTPFNTSMEQIPGLPPSMLASWAARGLTWKTADQVGMPGNLIPGDHNNFGPRLGVAYKLSSRMVIRASYGEYFWTMPLSQILQASRTNPPLNLRYENPTASLDGTGSYGARSTPASDLFIGKTTINTNGLVTLPASARPFVPLDPNNWRDGRAQSWHITIERELMAQTAIRLSYIGTHSSGMEQKYSINSREAEFNYVGRTRLAPPANRDLLRVNKDWNFSNATNKTGFANSNSAQIDIERRFTRGLAAQWFYVFSRTLTTSDAGGFTSGGGAINSTNGVFQVPENIQLLGGGNLSYDQRLRLGYQNSTNIPAHHMRWNGIYDLPFGKGKRFGNGAGRALDALIGGWQTAAIGEWRSGFWMGVNPAEYLFGNPSLDADQRLTMFYAGRQRRLWFAGDFNPTLATNVDQSALQKLIPLDRGQRVMHPVGASFNNQLQQVLSNGTVRNTPITETVSWNSRAFFKGPGAWGTDISVFKNFSVTERVRVRFTADFFNAFNHPNDATPDATTGLQDLTVQTNDPRTIQFSLRLTW
ncbi:MAG: TonB-dependent receptor [Bryobacterales bacterium]|nr:TonB-dependent receptor [Bryobacterales bacterium]